MGRNVKPILSVLIDEVKRDRFRRLADDNKLSMGWLLNDAIDRMLEANSIDIYKTSIGDTDTSPKSEGVAVSQSSIEEMIKTYVDSRLQNISIGNTDARDIEEMVKTCVDETVRESIGTAIEPIERLRDEIEEQIKELETFTRSQLEAMRLELKQSESDRVANDGDTIADDGKADRRVKKYYKLNESDRLELVRLLGDGITTVERNEGLGKILGWRGDKLDKSKNEDASKWKKALKDAGLL